MAADASRCIIHPAVRCLRASVGLPRGCVVLSWSPHCACRVSPSCHLRALASLPIPLACVGIPPHPPPSLPPSRPPKVGENHSENAKKQPKATRSHQKPLEIAADRCPRDCQAYPARLQGVPGLPGAALRECTPGTYARARAFTRRCARVPVFDPIPANTATHVTVECAVECTRERAAGRGGGRCASTHPPARRASSWADFTLQQVRGARDDFRPGPAPA